MNEIERCEIGIQIWHVFFFNLPMLFFNFNVTLIAPGPKNPWAPEDPDCAGRVTSEDMVHTAYSADHVLSYRVRKGYKLPYPFHHARCGCDPRNGPLRRNEMGGSCCVSPLILS